MLCTGIHAHIQHNMHIHTYAYMSVCFELEFAAVHDLTGACPNLLRMDWVGTHETSVVFLVNLAIVPRVLHVEK